MLLPVPVQQEIVAKAPHIAYAPTSLPAGWRYRTWTGGTTIVAIIFRKPGGAEADFFALPFAGSCASGSQGSTAGVYWNKGPARWTAWRCLRGVKLIGESLLASDRLSQASLVRFVASARRLGG